MIRMYMTVQVHGGLFHKNVSETARRAMYQESLQKIAARMERGGKGQGSKRNTVTSTPSGELEVRVTSTRIFPRVTGKAWQAKNLVIGRAMAPRVLKKAALRIVEELGG